MSVKLYTFSDPTNWSFGAPHKDKRIGAKMMAITDDNGKTIQLQINKDNNDMSHVAMMTDYEGKGNYKMVLRSSPDEVGFWTKLRCRIQAEIKKDPETWIGRKVELGDMDEQAMREFEEEIDRLIVVPHKKSEYGDQTHLKVTDKTKCFQFVDPSHSTKQPNEGTTFRPCTDATKDEIQKQCNVITVISIGKVFILTDGIITVPAYVDSVIIQKGEAVDEPCTFAM